MNFLFTENFITNHKYILRIYTYGKIFNNKFILIDGTQFTLIDGPYPD